ncbi:MAG: uracil-DNA glycosylase [Planctomycetes bacterium]|nr:uracil-DNA glycosylase [Planctomycetota bacterium]MBI3834311.1 uracil-DNA glycosylase [Planctomycetota bacterium]
MTVTQALTLGRQFAGIGATAANTSPQGNVGSRVERGAVSHPTLPRGAEGDRGGSPKAGFAPRPSNASAEANLARLKILDDSKVKGCTHCELHSGRTQTVFGQGSPTARIIFVGEGPGYEEDKQGLAFVGPAGQLLTKMIIAMGLTRDEVYICNVVKCRPPGNRTPSAEEILACSPYLHEQIAIIQPEMIIALGAPAAKTLLNTAESIGKLRGRFHQYHPPISEPRAQATGSGRVPQPLGRGTDELSASAAYSTVNATPLMPTYHPAYLLRNPDDKRKVWDDLQLVMARMGLGVKTAG